MKLGTALEDDSLGKVDIHGSVVDFYSSTLKLTDYIYADLEL